LIRVSLLIVATTLQCLSFIPPTPTADGASQKRFHKPTTTSASPDRDTGELSGGSSPKGGTRPKSDPMGSRLNTFYLSYTTAFSMWFLAMFEASRSFGHEDPLNRRLVFGTLLTTFGSLLRLSSFRTLGRYFTYQLAILPSHALMTTGPYAYVRHPSYVALPFTIFGWALTFTSRGMALCGWFGESNADRFVLGIMAQMFVVCWVFAKRAEVEDQALRVAFGKEWEEWAKVVRYRFIPGLY